MTASAWPPLPLDAWEDTYLTLHRWLQVAGKVALAHAPWMPHWWHVTLQVTPRGLVTAVLKADDLYFTLCFDFVAHEFVIDSNDGRTERFALEPMPVAVFYERALGSLQRLGVSTKIDPVPSEVVDTTPFPEDRHHAGYDSDAVERLHRILLDVDRIFREHRGTFLGKGSPSHFFWGAFDLAVTLFSGRPNPAPPADRMMREAYSHEVVSHGFWPGGDWITGHRMDEPVFYAYAVPEPPGFQTAAVQPAEARYVAEFGEYLLPYEAVRRSKSPEATLKAFIETTCTAAMQCGAWQTP